MKNKVPANSNSKRNQGGGGQIVAAEFSGPLPPPSILGQYEEIHPGLAERIVRMAEMEGEHRRQLEKEALDADIHCTKAIPREIRRGQYFAFILTFTLIALGAWLIYEGRAVSGTILSSIGFSGIILAFLAKRQTEKK